MNTEPIDSRQTDDRQDQLSGVAYIFAKALLATLGGDIYYFPVHEARSRAMEKSIRLKRRLSDPSHDSLERMRGHVFSLLIVGKVYFKFEI